MNLSTSELDSAGFRASSEAVVPARAEGLARNKGVNRLYPEALFDGVATDLTPRRYLSWKELERQTCAAMGFLNARRSS